MEYRGTVLTDALSVKEIFTVLRPDICRFYPGRGESHPFPEIFYLSRGKHTLLLDKREYTLLGGQMIIYAPFSFHESSQYRPIDAEASVLTFDADSQILSSLYNTVLTLTPAQRDRLCAIVEEGVGYFYWDEQSTATRGMRLRTGIDPTELWGLKKQIELFLIDVYRTHASQASKSAKELRHDAEFEAITAHLRAHLAEPMTLERIAKASSMSVSRLKLLFRDMAQMGPIEYLLRLRVERAKELICEGAMNFTQISEAVGFSSLHYFSRVFKSIAGLSPSEYKKSITQHNAPQK